MNNDSFPTAKSRGYRMPAEWEPHERCWMAWPCRLEMWGDTLAETEQAYANVANAIAQFEPVSMIVLPRDQRRARRLCSDSVTILPAEIDDSWTRDNGPNFVVDDEGGLAASVFQFNAWGKKHEPWSRDAALGHRLAEYLGVPTFTSGIFMEGGGINVDGLGTVLTTEQCILNDNRNPGLDREGAVTALCEALGAVNVVWLPGDPDDVETDGHVDGVACFVSPGRILVETCPARGTRRHDALQANLEAVRDARDAAGNAFEVVTIEEAYEAVRRSEIFSCSYINFYIANGAVIVPGYGIDRDQQARQQIAALFPDREIVQVGVTDIAVGGGGIHCITQQQPVSSKWREPLLPTAG